MLITGHGVTHGGHDSLCSAAPSRVLQCAPSVKLLGETYHQMQCRSRWASTWPHSLHTSAPCRHRRWLDSIVGKKGKKVCTC